MGGVKLAAKFALMPNCLGHCGTDAFAGVFGRHLAGRAEGWELKVELRKFAAHFSYLKLIADCNGLMPFDERVVEAFWLGNGLLENVGRMDIRGMMMERFVGRGRMSEKRARDL